MNQEATGRKGCCRGSGNGRVGPAGFVVRRGGRGVRRVPAGLPGGRGALVRAPLGRDIGVAAGARPRRGHREADRAARAARRGRHGGRARRGDARRTAPPAARGARARRAGRGDTAARRRRWTRCSAASRCTGSTCRARCRRSPGCSCRAARSAGCGTATTTGCRGSPGCRRRPRAPRRPSLSRRRAEAAQLRPPTQFGRALFTPTERAEFPNVAAADGRLARRADRDALPGARHGAGRAGPAARPDPRLPGVPAGDRRRASSSCRWSPRCSARCAAEQAAAGRRAGLLPAARRRR